ncbi:3'(2'),5'-bisphosphate nucleotidase CysQ [Shewanella sp. SR44-3]|uniref:3'(2'),5'-bisphosphate nucleotidase CysQ n=1 Tax=unclassified Shewanella TaxID=196818 RepID=UPI0015FA82AD|nr:3'(2'),5'-bisphosphate nucleotidase CysQ [Shewanella sp. SR44-3]MBB1268159.1 3'(2'),5'-bisphosphate nucleotidase CysQ [Shewanella sp. SR44-3]
MTSATSFTFSTAALANLVNIAKTAGEGIMAVYGKRDFAVQNKIDESPVTEADIVSHNVIVSALGKDFSQWPIMSEEAADIPWNERKHWETYWLIDPLDGTKEFIKRNGEFTVNIALIHQGQAVVGVVYAPVLESCYSGIKGLGAWREHAGVETRLDISQRVIGSVPVVVGSRSHISPDVQEYLAKLGEHQMQSVGSSLKFCLVAEGKADVYPRLGLTSEWDTAAAQAVLEAAGGVVVRYPEGDALKYNTKENILNPYFIAASKAWFDNKN